MKIRGNKGVPAGPFGVPANAGAAETEDVTPAETPAQDQIEISSQSRQVQELKAAVAQIPDVRTEKIEGIRDAVDEGSYHVESEVIAKRVVDDALEEAIRRDV